MELIEIQPTHSTPNAIRKPVNDFVARIKRSEIPGIHEMNVEGALRDLGVVKNFRNHGYLEGHLPAGVSISWTHLDGGQELEPHTHPVPSMIVIASGQGRSIGDSEVTFEGGDVLYIPAFNSHGFVGVENGFWALSIQFQETAIFESETDPLTSYSGERVPGREISVIRRGDLPTIREAEVNGETHDLGMVKNFAGNSLLKGLLPDELAMAWVHLDRGQTLQTHRHQEPSMILLTEGEGSCMGEVSCYLGEGDIVFVPPNHDHGFSGEGTGFWGLSIQFAPTSLYEEDPRVAFSKRLTPREQIEELNDRLAERFREHRIFDLIRSDRLREESVRHRFLAALQVWSGYFQRAVLARSAFTSEAKFSDVYFEHLVEEIGHDRSLSTTHEGTQIPFDAQLSGMSSWFVYQTLSLDNTERVVMTNLVLERAGSEFYKPFSEYMRTFGIEEHFQEHSEHDDDHEKLGSEFLDDISPRQHERVQAVQRDSWDMLGGILDRIVDIALGEERAA